MINIKKLACQLPYGGRKARKALSIRPQQVLSSRVPPSVCIHIRQKNWRKRKKIGEKEKRLKTKIKKIGEKEKKYWRKRKKSIGEKEISLQQRFCIGDQLRKPLSFIRPQR